MDTERKETNESKKMPTFNESNDKQEDAAGESHNMIDVYDQSYFNHIAK